MVIERLRKMVYVARLAGNVSQKCNAHSYPRVDIFLPKLNRLLRSNSRARGFK